MTEVVWLVVESLIGATGTIRKPPRVGRPMPAGTGWAHVRTLTLQGFRKETPGFLSSLSSPHWAFSQGTWGTVFLLLAYEVSMIQWSVIFCLLSPCFIITNKLSSLPRCLVSHLASMMLTCGPWTLSHTQVEHNSLYFAAH